MTRPFNIAVVAATLVSMVSLAAAPSARAAEVAPLTPEREARVTALVEQAREHRRAGDYERAITALREALDLHTAPWLLYSLARVYEDAGKYDLARSYYALCQGGSVDVETRARAGEGIARLDRIGQRGRLELHIMPEDATLMIDGEPWSLDESGAVMLTAGPHQVVVVHPDYVSHQQRVDVTGGQTTTVVVQLAKKPVVEKVEVVVERPVERRVVVVKEAPRDEVDFGAWKWLSLGFGAAAAGVGTYLIVAGQSDWDAVDEAIAKGTMTQRDANALRDEGTSKRTAGFVAAGVGGALVVTGIVLWALEREGTSPESDGAEALSVRPLFGATGGAAAVGLGGSF